MKKLKVSGKCPHCGSLTYLDSMPPAQFKRSENVLRSVLHALVCKSCRKRFGTYGGRLETEEEEG